MWGTILTSSFIGFHKKFDDIIYYEEIGWGRNPVSNWITIDELRDIFIRKYIDSELSNELEKACSEEYELMRDYNGRQILELLQNVDDAYGDKKFDDDVADDEVKVQITYKDNILEVGNTGTSFSKDTIERLCLGRASNKSSQNIGNKGTGFRSLLNDAEWVELYSGEFSIRFSEEFTKNLFEQYVSRDSEKFSELIFEQQKNWKKEDYDFCFPIMNCPQTINKIDSDFDTLIRVKLKKENLNKGTSVAKQLHQPFYKSLLFLPNITKIVIETSDDKKISEKFVDGRDVLIEKSDNKGQSPSEEYFIFDKEARIGDKFAKIGVAISKNSDYDYSKEKLYCYFPVRNFGTPIHALINAPFITNNSRDDVPDDSEEINKSIFMEILQFISEVAEKLSNPEYKDIALKMVTPFLDNKLWDTGVFDLKNEYLGILSNAKILPTVNWQYISIKDNPKLFIQKFPDELMGETFSTLLQLLETNENDRLVQELADYNDYTGLSFDTEELAEKINVLSSYWEDKIRTKVFLWWSEHYKSEQIVPQLLKNNSDNWVMKSDKVFLPTDTGVTVLPKELSSWVRLCILNQTYVDELIDQIKTSSSWQDKWEETSNAYRAERTGDKRILDAFSEKYLAIEFTEQSSSDLIIGTINRQIDTVEKSISFINWFYDNYNETLSAGSELSKVPFNLPNSAGDIRPSNKIYIGKEYGNELGDKLFQDTDYTALSKIECSSFGEESEFLSFILRCGVSKYPKIYDNDALKNVTGFKKFIYNKYKNEIKFTNINYLTSKYISNFEELINKLDTADIVNWINQDEELTDLLSSVKKESSASQQSNWSGLCFYSNEYVKYILNKTPWIEIDGEKYSPRQIVLYEKLQAHVPGLYGVSEQSLIELLGQRIVEQLDFRKNMAMFLDNEIRAILVELPKFDKGEISRRLYNELIRNTKGMSPTYSTEGLSVLAKDGFFYPNKELRYADKRLPKSIEKQLRFIYVPEKASTTTIYEWLGVERFKTNLKLESFDLLEDYSVDFKKEIDDIKTAVLSTIDENSKNVSLLKRIQIIPCSKISAKDVEKNGQSIILEDYYFVESKGKFYLKLPANHIEISQLRLIDTFSSAIVDIFKQVLNLSLDLNLIELLISRDTEHKQRKITEEFGVDKWNESFELLFRENALNKKVNDFLLSNGLNDKEYPDIFEIDYSYALKEDEFQLLAVALEIISKDINDLNGLSELIHLDIREFWKLKLRSYLDTKAEHYRQILYSNANKSNDEILKEIFLERISRYNDYQFEISEIPNSVQVDIEKESKKIFPELSSPITKEIDIDGLYDNNVEELLSAAAITIDDFDYYIRSHQKVASILYFGIPANLSEDILKFITKENDDDLNSGKSVISIEGTSTVQTILEPSNSVSSKSKNTRNGERSKRDYDNKNSANDDAGETAEQIAYAELTQNQKLNVIWHSKYSSKSSDRNKQPPNGIVCDMWVHDSENGNMYFEVKSSISEFEMSINEYNSMLNNPDSYEVVLVNRDTKEISRHKFDELDGLKQASSYLFKFKQKRSDD